MGLLQRPRFITCIYRAGGTSTWRARCGNTRVVVKVVAPPEYRAIEEETLKEVRGVVGYAQLRGAYSDERRRRCLVMDEYDSDLLDVVADQGGTGFEGGRRICGEVGDSLERMHRDLGKLHLDVKPENIFVRRGEAGVVLGDFGCVHSLPGLHLSCAVGTPVYCPPEVDFPTPDLPVCEESDAYSLAVTITTIISGNKPRASETREDAGHLLYPLCSGDGDRAFTGRLLDALEPDVRKRPPLRRLIDGCRL